MGNPSDPWTIPCGLTYVQTELWESDRLRLPRNVLTPTAEERDGEPFHSFDEDSVVWDDSETDRERSAVLMLLNHPLSFPADTDAQAMVTVVNELLRSQRERFEKTVSEALDQAGDASADAQAADAKLAAFMESGSELAEVMGTEPFARLGEHMATAGQVVAWLENQGFLQSKDVIAINTRIATLEPFPTGRFGIEVEDETEPKGG